MKVLLLSTYELGRQPFGLASPAAWLRRAGHDVVCADLAVNPFPAAAEDADFIAVHLPMHTATRLAAPVLLRVRRANPRARLCCYGLYAPLNEAYLRGLGADVVIGGEFEQALVDAANGDTPQQGVSLVRLEFLPPDRSDLPPLSAYAHLRVNGARVKAGYTEASRGCKHLCRHCPIVPVYNGRFRVVQPEVVLEDIRRQVASGAGHITFGDPDFFNGPARAVRIVEALHREFPALTYDVTIKVEHLKQRAGLLAVLKNTGCLFVTTAVESIEDEVLRKLEKGHTQADFVEVALRCRDLKLALHPTFIPFTPWTTRQGYRDLLRVLLELDLVDHVAPVQLALRLLVPAGSRLLELEEIRAIAGAFDQAALVYHWRHPDPSLDELASEALRLVWAEQERKRTRREIFAKLWLLAHGEPLPENFELASRATIPYLEEPWYC